MTIQVACERCEAPLCVPIGRGGMTIRCGRCNAFVAVPKPAAAVDSGLRPERDPRPLNAPPIAS
jgi:LSD1 subclass zinc finger protein